MSRLLLLPIFGIIISSSYADIFTVSSELTNTFQLESKIVGVLSELVAKTESKLDAIRRSDILQPRNSLRTN